LTLLFLGKYPDFMMADVNGLSKHLN